ncbi:ABC transporter permease [Pseudoxanthomonas sp. z9]|uniref:ABC transporter permease n=1 Tax=Pseudoxanthomonas sp. z9 TaxID=2584942 RepID=UPI001142AD18|nr:ABC transporter permease [Pseudoxanthomonas sp. z9]MCL6713486.1 ABC transporter permease [Pseudomonas sp. R2.Fl]
MDTAIARVRTPLRAYLLEARYEFLRLLRTPSFSLPTLLFPALFYLLFGVLLGARQGGDVAARYFLATYGVFGVMGVALFGFGVSVALDRERGLLALKRALPMPPAAYLLAKTAMAMIFAAVVSVLLALIAAGLAGVSLSPWQWATLWLVNVLGVLPFAALGLWLGCLVGGEGAPAVINLVYLPMAFLSGLWLPLSMLPAVLSQLAQLWPAYHLAQIALRVVGKDAGQPLILHVAVLALVTVVFGLLAWRRLARPA